MGLPFQKCSTWAILIGIDNYEGNQLGGSIGLPDKPACRLSRPNYQASGMVFDASRNPKANADALIWKP